MNGKSSARPRRPRPAHRAGPFHVPGHGNQRDADILTDRGAQQPDRELEQVTITFSKNRGPDIDRGRFIDRTYGVLGYEWLHMLAVLRQLLPPVTVDSYLRSDPRHAELLATYDPRLFVAALTERASLSVDGRPLQVELTSTVTGSTLPVTSAPPRTPDWKRNRRPADDRHRHVTLRTGQTRCTLHLDPVTATGGWQLERNRHRVTVERRAEVLHDQVLEDSPFETALRSSVGDVLGADPLPPPDLLPLQRIAAIAELLHTQHIAGTWQPTHEARVDPLRNTDALSAR